MRYPSIVLRAIVGAVFLYSAYTKLRDPWLLFAASLDAYHMLPEWAVLTVARTLPWFELLLGILLVAGLWLRYVSITAAALLGAFFAAMTVAYLRGLAIDCACFGPGDRLGPRTLARDGVLLALAIGLAVMSRAKRPRRISVTNVPVV